MVASLVALVALATSASARNFGLIVPMYNLTMIEEPPANLLAAAAKVPVRVVLGELADTKPAAGYMAGIAALKGAGIATLHYTHTRADGPCCHCCDTFAHITDRIALCDALWPGDPVFFDNGPFANQQKLFDSLYAYTQTHPTATTSRPAMMNPGRSGVEESYLKTLPNFELMGFEGTMATWHTVVDPGYPFHRSFNWSNYEQSRFSMIVEQVPTVAEMQAIVKRAAQADLNYGSMYVTDQPYQSLPSYFDELVSAVAALNSPATARATGTAR